MATVTTSGIWTSVNQTIPQLQGLNTSTLSWGVPYAARKDVNPAKKQSIYQFEGIAGSTVLTDGTEFKLGTFTHQNFGLNPPPITFSTNLKVTMAFDHAGGTHEFNFKFDHNETEGWNAPDEVQIPDAQSQETVSLDGHEYALSISGFKQDGKLVSKFISQENNANKAEIFAKLVAVAKVIPKPVPEAECRVKAVVSTSTLFSAALERLNRRSVVHLLEQLIAEVNEHCDKQIGANVNITQVLQQIEIINGKLLLIQKGTKKLDDNELGQINVLLLNLLQNIDLSKVIQNFQINVDGRTFSLQNLVTVLSTVDQVVNIQIQYTEAELGDIAGARFILTDQSVVIFNVRLVEQPGSQQLTYLFETSDWKGLSAHFSLVFSRRTRSYKLCMRTVNLDLFGGIEQTNIVFDLCNRIGSNPRGKKH